MDGFRPIRVTNRTLHNFSPNTSPVIAESVVTLNYHSLLHLAFNQFRTRGFKPPLLPGKLEVRNHVLLRGLCCCLLALADINEQCLSNIMAFGSGSPLLFIEGQDKMIVWPAGVITENRASFSGSAAAAAVSANAWGSRTVVIFESL